MDMVALQNFNFINIDPRNWSSKFQISISKIDYQTVKFELGHVTSPKLASDAIYLQGRSFREGKINSFF